MYKQTADSSFFQVSSDSADLGTYNQAFDDSCSIKEKPSVDESDDRLSNDETYPKSDEKIVLWHFDEPAET